MTPTLKGRGYRSGKVGATLARRSGLQVVAKVEATGGGQRSEFTYGQRLVIFYKFFARSPAILQSGGLDRRGTIVLRQGITLVLWIVYMERR